MDHSYRPRRPLDSKASASSRPFVGPTRLFLSTIGKTSLPNRAPSLSKRARYHAAALPDQPDKLPSRIPLLCRSCPLELIGPAQIRCPLPCHNSDRLSIIPAPFRRRLQSDLADRKSVV